MVGIIAAWAACAVAEFAAGHAWLEAASHTELYLCAHVLLSFPSLG